VTPNIASATKISGTVSHPAKVPQARTADISPSMIWQICATRLRS
jgi:hypothetical protein